MPHRVHVLLLLLLSLCRPAAATRVRKKTVRTQSCPDMPEEKLEEIFGRLSVGVMSAFHHALELEPQDKRNLTCPTARVPTDGKTRLPVNLLSISPWGYRISYNPKRYPRYIPEAYCLCKGCLIGPYGEESSQYRSTLVYAPSVILRGTGTCVNGRHLYTDIYVSIAVGCTCVPLLEKTPKKSSQSLQRREPKARKLFTPRKEA